MAIQFIELLREMGLFDESLIIIQSDHGSGKGYLNSNPRLKYKAAYRDNVTLSEAIEERARIVLWIKKPGSGKLKIDTENAQMIDISPTVVQLTTEANINFEGMDLLDTVPDQLKVRSQRTVTVRTTFDRGRGLYEVLRTAEGEWLIVTPGY